MKIGCARGCTTGLVAVLLVTGVAYAGFRYGGGVFPVLERWAGVNDSLTVGPVPSPQLAEATLQRLEAFRDGGAADERLELGGPELSSVVRYSVPGLIPGGVQEPTVRFDAGEMLLSARVAVSSFRDLPALDEVLGLLPDTVDIEMRGTLMPFDTRASALQIRRVEASRIPLPNRMVPGILSALGRTDREGLPSDAMAIPLPSGIRRAFIEDDHLVLVSEG